MTRSHVGKVNKKGKETLSLPRELPQGCESRSILGSFPLQVGRSRTFETEETHLEEFSLLP